MAFINEYISEEDIKKYGVKEAWELISPGSTGPDSLLTEFTWTVDKERNIYFIPMSSGKEEFSNQIFCTLWWGGALLGISLANVGGYLDFPNRKGAQQWDLINIQKPKDFFVDDSEIISALKEALTIYQLDGIRHPMSSYTVTFTF